MKIFFLLNPTHRKRLWELREEAGRQARAFGWTAQFGEVDRSIPRSTERLLDQAAEEGCARIVLVGGDGTYHRAINALQDKNRLGNFELALVPAGTCNDFSRFIIHSPKRQFELLKAACRGKPREVDLGLVRLGTSKTTRLFLNNAGFGRRVPVKGGERGSARKTLKSLRAHSLKLSWEKGSIEGRFLFGVICNAPFFSKGLHFSRAPQIDDGLLDAYLVPEFPRWKLAAALLRGRLGGTLMLRGVLTVRAARLEIETPGDLWPQVDGEPPSEKPVHTVAFGISPQRAMIVFP